MTIHLLSLIFWKEIIQFPCIIELYKFVNGLSPKPVSDCIKLKNMCIILETGPLSTLGLFTVLPGTESLSQLGPKIWALVPLNAFKKPLNNIGSQMLVHVDFVELFSNLYVLSVDLATSILNFSSVSLPS